MRKKTSIQSYDAVETFFVLKLPATYGNEHTISICHFENRFKDRAKGIVVESDAIFQWFNSKQHYRINRIEAQKIHLCLTSAEFPVDLSIKAGQDFYVAHRTEIRLTEQYCDSHGEEYVKGEIALAIYPKSHLHVSGFKVKKQHLQLFADFLKDFIEKDYGDCEGECVYLAQDEQSIAELKAISENIREYKAAQREKRKNKEWWQFWI